MPRWPNHSPEQQQEFLDRAAETHRRQKLDRLIAEVADRAGSLTPAQAERLRSLLPAPDDAQYARALTGLADSEQGAAS
jgi:hypothetical protein